MLDQYRGGLAWHKIHCDALSLNMATKASEEVQKRFSQIDGRDLDV